MRHDAVLRPARSTDAGAVGDILSAFIDQTSWMPRVHTRAQDLAHAGDLVERGWVTVVETKTGVAGFMARDRSEIHALYLSNSLRNQGFGKLLLQTAKNAQPTLSLWCFQANTGAQQFYRREGFVEVESGDGSGNDEGLPDMRFVWRKEETT